MNSKQAQNILITDYLASEGIQPAHSTHGGRFYWYHSPIREWDSKPSLKVDTLNNTWYDYGSGLFDHEKFRRLPDLVIAHKNVTFSEVLRILEYKNLGNPSLFATTSTQTPQNKTIHHQNRSKPQKKPQTTSVELVKVADLQNPHLISYLEGRGINADIAAQYVQEVYFKLPQKQSCLFAIGWPSGQGFDCRVEKGDFSFKGFVGQGKDIACINMESGISENIAVFEGWMDFLSFLTQKNITDFKHPAIIMFSVSQRKKALARIRQAGAKRLFLFLDNDDSGRDTTDFFTVALAQEMQVIDRSGLYQGFKDYNERINGKQDF